jgi:hypothetical protein
VADQLPLPGPEKGYCECTILEGGCGRFGLLGKPDPVGRRHARGCPCRRCIGRRSRRQGKAKQRQARKLLGIPGLSLGTDEEELWRGHVRVEVKSGARDTKPIDVRYRATRKQSDYSKAYGDHRPFASVAMPPGMSSGYAIVLLDDVPQFAVAVVESLGYVIDHESSKH